ncbi:hypothetical protein C0431_13205 [bacterium]|nr:hypothetical protein [bacterium]
MPTTLKLGLAPKKVSFFDQKTKLYLTLEEPFKEITVPDGADLSGLARGLFTLRPALVLLEGTFPEEEKEKFKQQYQVPFQIFKRADNIVENAPKPAPVEPEVGAQSFSEATLFDVNEPEAPAKDEKVEAQSLELEPPAEEEPVVEKKTTRKTTAKKTEA